MPTEQCILRDAAPAAFNCYAGYSSTTAIVVIVNEAGGTYVTANGVVTQAVPMTWASGDYGVITVSLPIVGISESMITGTFAEMMKVPNVDKPRTCKFSWGGAGSLAAPTACTASPCTTYLDSCSALTGTVTRSTTGDYNRDSTGWKPSTAVSCNAQSSGGFTAAPIMAYVTDGSGNLNIRARTYNGTVLTDASAMLECRGEAP